MKILIIGLIYLTAQSCINIDNLQYSKGDCFNSSPWINLPSGETSISSKNTVLQIAGRNPKYYIVALYSLTEKKFFKGGFSVRKDHLDSNGKILCPSELKNLKLLQEMIIDMTNSPTYFLSRKENDGLRKIR